MKFLSRILIAAACFAPALTLNAQTLLTDFSSASGWDSPLTLVGTNGTFGISGGVANYTASAPGESEFTLMRYTGAVGSYVSNWSIQVSVSYATPSAIFDSGVDQAINVGLMVTPTGASLGVSGGQPTFDAFLVSSNLYHNSSNVGSRDMRTSTFVANAEPVDGERYAMSGVASTSSSVLTISFDATTKILTASYDLDGAGGAAPVAMDDFGHDLVNASTWGMSTSDTFSFYLVGNSMYDSESGSGVGPTIALAGVTLDDLYGSGGVSAVPEPSTYAALCGALVLGFAVWRRRRR